MGFEQFGVEIVESFISSRAEEAASKFNLKWARPFKSARLRATLAIAAITLVILTDLLGLAPLVSLRIDAIVIGPNRLAFDVATTNLIAIVGALVAFLVWIERAYRNLPALGATHPCSSPLAASICLFFPKRGAFSGAYLVMSEIWGHSDPAQQGKLRKHGSRLVMCWWAGYILCFLIWAVAESLMTVGQPDYGVYRIVFYVAQVFGAATSILLVYSIDRNQKATHDLNVENEQARPTSGELYDH